ncbi:MAG TPA: TetR family transcriptional regulator [Nocardioides sp.]|nr:TetR family transcriptional regulator [Nocardioides sp.]
MTKPDGPARTQLLDAAERILVREGHAGVTTRRVGAEAGLNHGLIHYYFGSLDELFVQVFERFTADLLERQRALYSSGRPFIEVWRDAMAYLDKDVADGYQKVWGELYSRALNSPTLGPRVTAAYEAWRQVLRDGFRQPYDDLGMAELGLSLESVVTLVITFNAGLGMEQLVGVRTGHAELLADLDRWMEGRAR